MVRTQSAVYDLSAYMGEAPHKLCVPVGTRWAYERTDIKDAYTGFEAYVGGGAEPWATTGVEDNLYPLDGVAYEMKTYMVGKSSYSEISSTSETTYSYTLADAVNEHIWWSDVTGSTKFIEWGGYVPVSAEDLNAAEIGNGTIIRFYFACENDYMIKATDNTWEEFELDNSGWYKNYISGNAKNGYVEFKLNTTTANRYKKNGLIIQGTGGVTALALTYDNSQKKADEVPATPETIWTGSQSLAWNLDIQISKDKFANATSTSKIRFTATAGEGWSQIHIKKKLNQWEVGDIAQVWASNPNDWPGSCEFTIGEYLDVLQNNDICIQGGGLILTKVELIP